MTKIFYCFFVAFSLISINASAQKNESTIYLKDGNVIKGTIDKHSPDSYVKIRLSDGNIYFCEIADIEKISMEQVQSLKISNYMNQRFNKASGYMGLVEFGVAPGLGKAEKLRLSATIVNGYRFLPQFAIGVGVGVQGYVDKKEMTVPVFLHMRSDILDKAISPVVAFNVGYNIPVIHDTYGGYGGLLFEPSIGVSLNVSTKYHALFSLGCTVEQESYYEWSNLNPIIPFSGPYHHCRCAISFKLGFSF